MAMAMGAASKTTMVVTMSMPSRTTSRRTTSGTREVRARVVDDDDDASRLGPLARSTMIDSGTPRTRRMEGDEETRRAHTARVRVSSSSSRARSVRVVWNRARDVHDEGRGRLEREGFFLLSRGEAARKEERGRERRRRRRGGGTTDERTTR
jgi:hypothetical protein